MKRTIPFLAVALLIVAAPAARAVDGITIACAHRVRPPLQAVIDQMPGTDAGRAYAARATLMRVARRACRQPAARWARPDAQVPAFAGHVEHASGAPRPPR